MPVTLLDPQEKIDLKKNFENGLNQTELASHFMVSRRTIQRALIEMGLVTCKETFQVNGIEKAILNAVYETGIEDADSLRTALSKPVLSKANIMKVLCRLPEDDLEAVLHYVNRIRETDTQADTVQAQVG